MASMTSTKPYLFRGIYEWIEDNNMTPHIVVDANGKGVFVPQEYVNDGQITLNISSASIELYRMDNQVLHFSARFNGISQELTIPMSFILGIYARENGQGMFFEAGEYPEHDSELDLKPVDSDKNKTSKDNKTKKTDSKRNGSHLKIIK